MFGGSRPVMRHGAPNTRGTFGQIPPYLNTYGALVGEFRQVFPDASRGMDFVRGFYPENRGASIQRPPWGIHGGRSVSSVRGGPENPVRGGSAAVSRGRSSSFDPSRGRGLSVRRNFGRRGASAGPRRGGVNQARVALDLHRSNCIGTVNRWFIVCYCAESMVSDKDIEDFVHFFLQTAPGLVNIWSGPSFVLRCLLPETPTVEDFEKGLQHHLEEAKNSDIGIIILKERNKFPHFGLMKQYFSQQKINRQGVAIETLKKKDPKIIHDLILQVNRKIIQWPEIMLRNEIDGIAMNLGKLAVGGEASKTS